MFTVWILDQQERDDDTGEFARLLWADINNGCAPSHALKSAVEWKEHFAVKHPKICERVNILLVEAYVSYVASFSVQK